MQQHHVYTLESQDYRSTGSQGHRITGLHGHRVTGSQDHRIKGSQDHRITGSQGHRVTGSQGHRVTGSQGHRVKIRVRLKVSLRVHIQLTLLTPLVTRPVSCQGLLPDIYLATSHSSCKYDENTRNCVRGGTPLVSVQCIIDFLKYLPSGKAKAELNAKARHT